MQGETDSVFEILTIMEFMSIFAYAYQAAKRGDDATVLLSAKIYRIPNTKGYLFNVTWGKTLRDGSTHVFGLMCSCKEDPVLCAICIIEDYVHYAKEQLRWEFDHGRLFPPIKLVNEGGKKVIKRMKYKMETYQISDALKFYMNEAGNYEGETSRDL